MSSDNNIIDFPKNKHKVIDFYEIEEKLRVIVENSNDFPDSEISDDNKIVYSTLINCLGEIQSLIFRKIENTFSKNADRCVVFALLLDILETNTKYDEFVN